MGHHINATDYGFNSSADILRFSKEVFGNDIGSYDFFGGWILVMVFTVSIMSTLRYGPTRAYTFAAFLTALTSVILYLIGIVSEFLLIVPGILTISSVLILYVSRSD